MPNKSWKNFELRMATRFGTIREGATGDDGADFYTQAYSVQCKLRKRRSPLADGGRQQRCAQRYWATRMGLLPLSSVRGAPCSMTTRWW